MKKKKKKRKKKKKGVKWSEQDGAYIGKCPDLITGIHGDDPKKVYADLCKVVEDVIAHFEAEGRPLPAPRVRPMQEVVLGRSRRSSVVDDHRAGVKFRIRWQ